MHAQSNVVTETGGFQGTTPYPHAAETHLAVRRIAATSLWSGDLVAAEVGRLLEDVRITLDRDLGAATKTAERLAALLASKLPEHSRSAPARGGLAPWQKTKIRNYIGDRLAEPLPLKDLAKLVSLSASHFGRAFKESFGERPHDHITRTRVEQAQSLMLTTPESLSQISLACGFADQAHLCRRFRQVTGTTPGAWRRSRRMEP